MGEHACCMDAVSAAEEGRIADPILRALTTVGISDGATAHEPRPLRGKTGKKKRYPLIDKRPAPRLLCNHDRMALRRGVRRHSERETGPLGRAECDGRGGGVRHLLSLVHVAAFAAERHFAGVVRVPVEDERGESKAGGEEGGDSGAEWE